MMARLSLLEAENRYYLFRQLAILISGKNPDGTNYRMPIEAAIPSAADIRNGRVAVAATTAATTLLTVPAGRTWVGEVGASVACTTYPNGTTAGLASAVISTAGAGVTPAAGNVFGVDAMTAQNLSTGGSGIGNSNFGSMPLTVVAPAENDVTIQVAATITGTAGRVDAFASGKLD